MDAQTTVSDQLLVSVLGTKTKLTVLEQLARGGPATQADLARSLDVTQSSVSRAKHSLIAYGLVTVDDDNKLMLTPPAAVLVNDLLMLVEQHSN